MENKSLPIVIAKCFANTKKNMIADLLGKDTLFTCILEHLDYFNGPVNGNEDE